MYSCLLCTGKLCDGLSQGVSADYVQFPDHAKVMDLSTAGHYMLALTVTGEVYYWGKNQVTVCIYSHA